MANVDDKAALANQALNLLGAKTITVSGVGGFDSGTKEANLLASLYDFIRKALLRSHLWNFAVRRANLSEYNLLTNPGFELGNATPDDWTAGGSADLDRHTTLPYAGTYSLEINENGADNPYAYQAVTVKEFEKYALEAYVKAGTEATYKVAVYDVTNSAYIDAGTNAEATTAWAQYEATDFTIPKNCTSIEIRLFQVAASGAGTTLFFDAVKLTNADWGYDYTYELPSDCLRTLRMKDLSSEFKIESGYLLTDESEAKILYLVDQETVATFDELFKEAFAAKLAAEMCYTLTHSASLTTLRWKIFDNLIKDARSIDAQEGTPDVFEIDDWIKAR